MLRYSFAFLLIVGSAFSQVLSCVASANPPLLRLEGISERTGDVAFSCSGGPPNAVVKGNLVVFLSVNVTNRVMPDTSANVLLTVNGAPANVLGSVNGLNAVAFNGLSFTLSPQGTAELRLQNLRGNMSQQFGQPGRPVTLYATFTGGSLLTFTSNQFSVGVPLRALYATSPDKLVCSQAGSPLPSTLNFTSLLAANTSFATTRVTEGFATAFAPKSDVSNQDADNGVRIISTYSGFPAGARLFVPDTITGSDADQPTSAGDFGLSASPGAYTPGKGQLLLLRVIGADPAGAGGTLASATTGAMSELTLTSGAAYAVYEVVDSSPTIRESALLPVFLGLAPNGPTAVTDSTVNLASVSNVFSAGEAPIPRFIRIAPDLDCSIVGDCAAGYFPQLWLGMTSLQLTAPASATGYIPIRNNGSGALRWTASTTAAFLRLSPAQGVNNSTLRVDAITTGLAPGTYNATVVIDAGPIAGSRSVPVTVVISAEAFAPQINSIANAANGAITAVVPGSLASIYGVRFTGGTLSVTFDGSPARVLFSNDTQINVEVPSALAGRDKASLLVSVGGNSSAPFVAIIMVGAPAIFPGAVLNEDWKVNSESAPAAVGSVLQIFVTGLKTGGRVTATVHDRISLTPAYAGPAPGLPGVQQVNVVIPTDLPAMQTYVYVCGENSILPKPPFGFAVLCGPAEKLWIR